MKNSYMRVSCSPSAARTLRREERRNGKTRWRMRENLSEKLFGWM